MIVLSDPRARACRGCGRAATIYRDKYGHLWCVECERWNGPAVTLEQPALFEMKPRWPGDRWSTLLS